MPRSSAFSLASSSIRSEKSAPTTRPDGADPRAQLEREVAGAAAEVERRVALGQLGPVGGPLRQPWWRPAVIAVFIRS